MAKYMSYLFVVVRKRWSTYIIPIVGCGLFALMIFLQINRFNKNGFSALQSMNTFVYFFPFVFGALFVSTKALNIFKDGESDGTELLIASKQIKRSSIVLGKFFTMYTLIITFNILIFITTFASGFKDSYASMSDIWKFALSCSIGGIVIMFILSSIIILIASTVGHVGTLTLSILIPVAIPIISFTIVPLGGGYGSSLSSYIQDTNFVSMSADKLYDSSNKPTYEDGNDFRKAYEELEGSWYKYAAPFDVWQHWNGFYKMFQNIKATPDTMGIKWTTKESSSPPNSQKSLTMEFIKSGSPIQYLFATSKRFENYGYNDSFEVSDIDVKATINMLNNNTDWSTDMAAATTLLNQIKNMEKIPESDIMNAMHVSQNGAQNRQLYPLLLAFAQNNSQITQSSTIKSIDVSASSKEFLLGLGFIESHTKFDYIVGAPFVPKNIVIIVYTFIAVALSALVVQIYLKRDFK